MNVFLCSEHIRDYRAACLSPGIEYSKQYQLHNPSLSGSKWHSKEGSPGPLQQLTDGVHTVWTGRDKLHTLFHILVTSERSSVISPCFTRAIYTKELFAELFFKKARRGPFLRKGHLPASKTEQFVFIGYGWLLLKLPHQDIDQVWVFNYNRYFLKHVLKGDACLFQSVKHVKDTWGWWSARSAKLSVSHISPNYRALHTILGAWGRKWLPSLSPVTWVTLKMIWIWARKLGSWQKNLLVQCSQEFLRFQWHWDVTVSCDVSTLTAAVV